MITLQEVFDKMQAYAEYDEGQQKYTWTFKNADRYRQWLIKTLKRNPKLRDEMMNTPKRLSNNSLVLEHFSKNFVMQCGVEISDASAEYRAAIAQALNVVMK